MKDRPIFNFFADLGEKFIFRKGPEKDHISVMTWEAYNRTKDINIRNKILTAYLPLVKSTADRMVREVPDFKELPDLISTGVLALMEAFNNFDHKRGVKFETYAVPVLRKAILDELRQLDWVPSSTSNKSRKIEEALQKLEKKLERLPNDDEINQDMAIKEEKVAENYRQLGLTLYDLDQLEQATEMFKRSIDINPNSAEAYFYWALALWKLGKIEDAKKKLEVAEELYEELGRRKTYQRIGEVLKELESKK